MQDVKKLADSAILRSIRLSYGRVDTDEDGGVSEVGGYSLVYEVTDVEGTDGALVVDFNFQLRIMRKGFERSDLPQAAVDGTFRLEYESLADDEISPEDLENFKKDFVAETGKAYADDYIEWSMDLMGVFVKDLAWQERESE